MSSISLKNVTMAYTKNYNILQDINLEVKNGEKVLLIGSENSGKTSVIRIILGLEKKFSGSAIVAGKYAAKLNFKRDLSALYISSRGAFLEGKTCFKNIEYVLAARGEKKYDSPIKIYSALKAYGIYSYKDIKAKRLSKFNRVMLQLARANFRQHLDLLCVDDIFDGLTEVEKEHVIRHINTLIAEKKPTCIIAVSDEKTADAIGGRKVKINLGSIQNAENGAV